MMDDRELSSGGSVATFAALARSASLASVDRMAPRHSVLTDLTEAPTATLALAGICLIAT